MSMLWYLHFIWKLRRYLGKMFFLVDLCMAECIHGPGKKPYVDKNLYHTVTANILVRNKAVCQASIYLTLQTKSRMLSFHSSICQAEGCKWRLHAFSKQQDNSLSFPIAQLENEILKLNSAHMRYKNTRNK